MACRRYSGLRSSQLSKIKAVFEPNFAACCKVFVARKLKQLRFEREVSDRIQLHVHEWSNCLLRIGSKDSSNLKLLRSLN